MRGLISLGAYLHIYIYIYFSISSVETSCFSSGTPAQLAPKPSQFCGCEITLSHTIVGRNPLDKRSAQRRDFYLTTHNTQKTNIHAPAGFEHINPRSERPQTHALDRAASGIGQELKGVQQVEVHSF